MGSYPLGKIETVAWIRNRFRPGSTILDVGACNGKWRTLLPEYVMDAVEIFEPYARTLTGYRNVFITDIADLEYTFYDLILFGDVIEHMTTEKAQAVLKYAHQRCRDLIISVPFLYKQDEVDGNIYQRHIQDDLTPAVFAERYPGYKPIWSSPIYSYYHKSNGGINR